MKSTISKKIMVANIPVMLDCPEEMNASLRTVLRGEYEFGYFGENLTVLDMGANVGSFTMWANLRWPKSKIHAYEPDPGTFKILAANVESLSNVTCHNLAVYPSEKGSELFWSRYAGDGEAGIDDHVEEEFKGLSEASAREVAVIHPRSLPKADVIKLDVEGAESMILREMALQDVSLILLEYHTVKNRDFIKELLRDDFALEYEDGFRWGAALPGPGHPEYKEEWENEYEGHLFFANRLRNKLKLYRGRKYC